MPHLPEDLPFAIHQRRIDQGVGYVALLLPGLLLALTLVTGTCFYATLSHFYFSRIGGDLFVGALIFIGLMLTFFYGARPAGRDGVLAHRPADLWLVRAAGFCALLIAFLPTTGSGCAYGAGQGARVFLGAAQGSEGFLPPDAAITGRLTHDFWASFASFGAPEAVPSALASLHFAAAAVMFAILGYFSLAVFTRHNSAAARSAAEPGSRKALRNRWYRGLGIAIYAAAGAVAAKFALTAWILPEPVALGFGAAWDGWRVTFLLETVALMCFGLSWLIKGRFIAAFEDEALRAPDQRREA